MSNKTIYAQVPIGCINDIANNIFYHYSRSKVYESAEKAYNDARTQCLIGTIDEELFKSKEEYIDMYFYPNEIHLGDNVYIPCGGRQFEFRLKNDYKETIERS